MKTAALSLALLFVACHSGSVIDSQAAPVPDDDDDALDDDDVSDDGACTCDCSQCVGPQGERGERGDKGDQGVCAGPYPRWVLRDKDGQALPVMVEPIYESGTSGTIFLRESDRPISSCVLIDGLRYDLSSGSFSGCCDEYDDVTGYLNDHWFNARFSGATCDEIFLIFYSARDIFIARIGDKWFSNVGPQESWDGPCWMYDRPPNEDAACITTESCSNMHRMGQIDSTVANRFSSSAPLTIGIEY